MVNLAAMALAFISQVVLARVLGASAYGEYAYLLVWVNFLVFVGKFGWDTAALRFLPAFGQLRRGARVRQFKRHALRFASVLSVSLMVCAVVASIGVHELFASAPFALSTALMAGALVPLFSATLIWAAFAQSRQEIIVAQGLPNLARPTLILIGVAALTVNRGALDASDAMLITLLAAVCIALLSWRLEARAEMKDEPDDPLSSEESRDWGRTAYALFAVTTLTTLLNQMDLQILGLYETAAALGVYAAAARLAMLIPFPTTAANTGVAPLVARLHAEGRNTEIAAVIRSSARWTNMAGLFAFAVLVGAGEQCLSLFGEDFRGGRGVLAVLSLARLLQALTGLGGHLLNMTGHQRDAVRAVGAAVVVQAVSGVALAAEMGALGAAFSAVLGALVWSILITAACIRRLGVNPLGLPMRAQAS